MRVGVSLDRKRELCAEYVTLNGKAAVIMGATKRFATVAALEGCEQATWAWETVDRIVNDGGAFRAD